MQRYILRRLLLFVPSLLGASMLIFVLLRIIPGDVAAVILAGASGEANYTEEQRLALHRELGLDRPLHVQYGRWLWSALQGDFGRSYTQRRPVAHIIRERFPVTLQLTFFSFAVIVLTAVPIGIVAAARQDTALDYVLRSIAILGLAAPSFWIGVLIVLILSIFFRWLPPIGFTDLWQDPLRSAQQLIFPALALGFALNGYLLRMTRGQLLEVLREDYIRTARAKGLQERLVLLRHAVRNALLPVVTVAGFLMALLLSGSVAIELIFNLPGMGQALISAVHSRDLPVIEAFVLLTAGLYLSINLAVDLTYAWLDPRIRYE